MIGQIEHVFSHLTWNINVYKGQVHFLETEAEDLRLVTAEEMKEFSFSVSHQKVLQQFIESEAE